MFEKSLNSLFFRIFNLLVLFSLAAVPLGSVLAVQSEENTPQQPLVDAKSQPPSTNPLKQDFKPQEITSTTSYSGPVFNIPDAVWAGTCFPLVVSATGTITDVRLVNVAITHTWTGDLRLDLIHPGGSYLTILNRAPAGPTTAWFNLAASYPLNFYDGAPTSAAVMGNTLTGTDAVICRDDGFCDYTADPDGYPFSVANFSAFDGLAASGTWQVCIADGGTGDTGSISAFTLLVSTNTQPSVTISSSASDPTSTSPIPATITFDSPVTGFTSGAITVTNGTVTGFSGGGTTYTFGATTYSTTYTVDITPTSDGSVTVSVPAGVATDLGGTTNAASALFTRTYDSGSPTPSINSTATNPTGASPIPITITFTEDMTGFTDTDLTITNGTVGSFTPVTGQIYTANIAPTAEGAVTVNIVAGVATDLAGNPSLAAAPFSITYSIGAAISVSSVSLSRLIDYSPTNPASFEVRFSKDASNPAGHTDSDDVTNPANYVIVETGNDGNPNTVSCLSSPSGDDQAITVNSVGYNNSTFTSTVNFNNGIALPIGKYRLLVCGTTSIVDAIGGVALNGGSDFTFDFEVVTAATSLPDTGFAPGKITRLPTQSREKAYADYGDLWLEIPTLGVKTSILGVPRANTTWDVSWLGSNAGWLEGTAFPTWSGNSVITGHVWDARNNPGPFYNLKNLKYGDQILVHAWGYTYTFEVRSLSLVTSRNVASLRKPGDLAWVTLMTCESFNPDTESYLYRRLVQAVLVSATPQP